MAKADDDVKLSSFVGDETEVSVTGIVETIVKEFNFPKHTNQFDPMKLRILASLKTNVDTYTASLKVYMDSKADPRITLTSTSTVYELVAGAADIDDIDANKKHTVKVALVSNDATGTASNDLIDAMLVQ